MNEEVAYLVDESEMEEELIAGFDHSGISPELNDGSDFDEEELKLGFIRLVGSEFDGYYQYEFIFTNDIENFWGENFSYMPAGLCYGLTPYEKYINKVVLVKSKVKLDLAQNSTAFSMQECMDGIVALAWESLEGYEVYPDVRVVFQFGDDIDTVERKWALKSVIFDM